MFTETPRQFDLYDFFSVFIPGATVLVGLYPFLPTVTNLGSLGLLLPTIILGFVFGRAIHNLGMRIDSHYDRESHRDTFQSEMTEPSILPENIIDTFYQKARDEFPELGLPESREDIPDNLLGSLYVAVRGFIHFDARGRSRTFQAVYAFFRSIEAAALILGVVYYGYGFLVALELNETVSYTSYLGQLGIPSIQISLFGLIIFVGSFFAFRKERWNYQDLYIEYLIMDFLTLKRTES